MNVENFDELVSNCVMSGFKNRMLYVFLRVGAMDSETKAEVLGPDAADEDAGFVQVLFDAHQPAAHGLTFDSVRETADAQTEDWDLVVVGIAQNSDASLPTDEQARSFLANMRDRILAGDVSDFAILDRTGNPVAVETEVVPDSGTDPVH